MRRLGNSVMGNNRDGWRVQRQEARERIIVPAKFVGGVLLFSIIAYSFIVAGFLLPG
ncbi:MAG: hypothetical protein AAB630_02010 [Patescibacteria group bacterium]